MWASPLNKVCVFLNPYFDMVNGIWADFYHLMLDNVSDLDTRSGVHGLSVLGGQTVTINPIFRWFAAGTRPWVGSESTLSDQYEPHGTVTNFGYYHKIHKGVTNVGTELYGENRVRSFTNRQGKVRQTVKLKS